MSGTNTICVVTVLIETGMVPAIEPVTHLKLDTPAGLIAVDAEVTNGKVRRVTFRNVPAFAAHLDAPVEVQGLGTVTVDVAWGGKVFYVIADAALLGFRLTPDEARDIVRTAEMIKAAAREQLPVAHPENPEIAGISIAQLSGEPSASGRIARTRWWCRRARSIGRGRRRGRARSTVRRAGPARAPRWRRCMRRASLPLHQDFVHEGDFGDDVHGAVNRRDARGAVCGGCSDSLGTGVDHGVCELCAGPGGSVSERVHGGRYLGFVALKKN